MTPTPPAELPPEPPPRPTSFDEVGFEPQRPVVWFSPSELVLTAKKLAISKVFGDYADKRELIGTLPDPGIVDYRDRDELWVDYVADLGDGFDATYSVASLLAARNLPLDALDGDGQVATRRGDVLVMGGDEVYPAASIENYENRTIGPYKAALPLCDEDHPSDLFVIPGNHDWYDGLTAWMRMFAQRKNLGGWQTHQSRSYFALRLPHGWWLWGIDVQFDSYIDVPQMDHFHRVVDEVVQPGDQIILCSATPEWVDSHRVNPESYRTLDYFERKIIAPSGATVRVSIAGNAHHYAHFVSTDGEIHKLTAGGGGAYLSATHGLPDRLTLPPTASTDRNKSEPAVGFHRVAEYPSEATSARLGRGVWRLPKHNTSFAGLIGVVYAFYALSTLSSTRQSTGRRSLAAWWDSYVSAVGRIDLLEAVTGLIWRPSAALVTLVLAAALFGLTKRRGPRRWAIGAVHALAQTVMLVGVVTAAFAVGSLVSGWGGLVVGFVLAVVVGAVAGSLVLATYLSFGDRFGRNVNEQFSSMRIEGFKNFLRMKVSADGGLTIYPIGVPDVVHDWKIAEAGQGEDPWIVPDGAVLAAELIEQPIHLRPRAST